MPKDSRTLPTDADAAYPRKACQANRPYEGILLATDWDGTLSTEGSIPTANLRAIQEFQSGGGYFTVISGRTPAYLSDYFLDFSPNTYTVGLNGARIEDLRTGDVLYNGFCDDGLRPLLSTLLDDARKIVRITVYCKEGGHDLSLEEARQTLPSLPATSVYKTVFITETAEDAEHLLLLAHATPHDGYEVVRSFPTGVELLAEKNGKGAALLRLKRALAARFAVAVGDFENDISLLRAADVGYAVGDAVPSLKAVAKRVVCPAREGAIAAVVEDIKKRGI